MSSLQPPVSRVLIVEDDAAIRRFVRQSLEEAGHQVFEAEGLQRGLVEAGTRKPDLLVLDLGLPDGDGVDLIRDLRGWSSVPVIVLSARTGDDDKIAALDAGADDYLIKPFSAAQVMARVRAVLRRTSPAEREDPRVVVGGLVVDPVSRTAALDGVEMTLNRKEFDLLFALASRPGEVVTKRQLLAEVWQMPWGGADRTVDVHLSWLRRKLGETAAEPRYLVSVRGVGVKLVDPGTP
jgi:DNA-binding response OmpR family regulator